MEEDEEHQQTIITTTIHLVVGLLLISSLEVALAQVMPMDSQRSLRRCQVLEKIPMALNA